MLTPVSHSSGACLPCPRSTYSDEAGAGDPAGPILTAQLEPLESAAGERDASAQVANILGVRGRGMPGMPERI